MPKKLTTHPQVITPELRVRRARKAITNAQAQAQIIKDNPAVSRSTATRAAYKHGSDALASVLLILSGKE